MRSYRMIKELNKLSSFGFCKEMNHFKRTLVFLTLRVALFVMSPRWNWGYVDQSCCLLRTFSMKRVGVKRGDRAFSSHGRRCLLSYGMVSRKFIRLLISPSPPLHLQHGKEEVVMRPSQARKEREEHAIHFSSLTLSISQLFFLPSPSSRSISPFNANPQECRASIFLAAEAIIMRERGCLPRSLQSYFALGGTKAHNYG